MYVPALRHLGTARTGAHFSKATFVGLAMSLVMLGDAPGPLFWTAALLMGGRIWLHLTENHEHEHEHVPMEHVHEHSHDSHHTHEHNFDWDGKKPHASNAVSASILTRSRKMAGTKLCLSF